MQKDKGGNAVSEMVKSRRLDQRTLQQTSEEQFYCYFGKEFVDALGLKKGGKLILILQDDRIEVYPEEAFLAKAGMGLADSNTRPTAPG